GERYQVWQRPFAIAELAVRHRFGEGQLNSQDCHIGDFRGAAHAGGDAEGVGGPAGERFTQRSGSLE
ncbi:MAG TPA: hypothetical protein VE449_03675, partial [Thermoleophilaceae bacterium]|nr:hypothetical protein [Thermoleophilaceae bacterium]